MSFLQVMTLCEGQTFPDSSENVVFRTFPYLKIRTVRFLEVSWSDLLTQQDVLEGCNPEVPFAVYEE